MSQKLCRVRWRLVSQESSTGGIHFFPTPPRHPAVRSDPNVRGMSGFWTRQVYRMRKPHLQLRSNLQAVNQRDERRFFYLVANKWIGACFSLYTLFVQGMFGKRTFGLVVAFETIGPQQHRHSRLHTWPCQLRPEGRGSRSRSSLRLQLATR